MTLLAVERIKLFSTRSSWWCMVLTLACTVGLAGLMAIEATVQNPATTEGSQRGFQFGLAVIMVLAVLAVTTEYRTGTIRTTFQAVPNRTAALLAKTATVALVAGVVGEIAAFASFAATKLLAQHGTLTLVTATEWRTVAGSGLIYALAAVAAVAVGILIRHTAGAVALVLVYTLMVENLVYLIPRIGEQVHAWLPFTVVEQFRTGGDAITGLPGDPALGPWASLAYFAGFAAVLLIAALGVARRRDA